MAAQRFHQAGNHVLVVDVQRIVNPIAVESVQLERLLLLYPQTGGDFAGDHRRMGVDIVTRLRHAETDHWNRQHRQADIAKAATARNADAGVVAGPQLAEDYRQTLFDGSAVVAKLRQNLADRSLVIRVATVAVRTCRWHAKEHLLVFHSGFSDELGDDLSHHQRAMRLIRIQDAFLHGPPG